MTHGVPGSHCLKHPDPECPYVLNPHKNFLVIEKSIIVLSLLTSSFSAFYIPDNFYTPFPNNIANDQRGSSAAKTYSFSNALNVFDYTFSSVHVSRTYICHYYSWKQKYSTPLTFSH